MSFVRPAWSEPLDVEAIRAGVDSRNQARGQLFVQRHSLADVDIKIVLE